MERKCALCEKTHDLFSLDMKTDDGEKYTKYVCGSCWDVIFAIAKKAAEIVLDEAVANGLKS